MCLHSRRSQTCWTPAAVGSLRLPRQILSIDPRPRDFLPEWPEKTGSTFIIVAVNPTVSLRPRGPHHLGAGSPSSWGLGLYYRPPHSSPRDQGRPAQVLSSQSVILVPLEVRGGHSHGFAAQEGGPAQGGAGAGHVRDGRRIWEGESASSPSQVETKGSASSPLPRTLPGLQ